MARPVRPPDWAEAWLRFLLPLRDRDTVSGDLLEEYRERIRPSRTRWAADLWYISQVARFAAPLLPWALAVAAIFIGRAALDWLFPPVNQKLAAEIMTLLVFGAPLVIGFATAWRTQSAAAGAIGAMTALVLAAVMCAVATGLLLMIGHSALVPGAVERSGGILEAFLLPFLIVLPGGVDAWIGASLAMWPQISRRLGAD